MHIYTYTHKQNQDSPTKIKYNRLTWKTKETKNYIYLNIRPSITQPPVAPCAGHHIQTTHKTKVQTQSSADRITTSLSLAHQRKRQTNK